MSNKDNNEQAGRKVILKIEGTAYPHTDKFFQFVPDESKPQIQGFRRRGVATMTEDGNFGFCPTPSTKPKTQKLKRSAHGSLSANEESFYLVIRIDKEEGVDWRNQMMKETKELLQ